MPIPAVPVSRATFFSSANGPHYVIPSRQIGKNSMYYTINNHYMYKPHSGYGQVGTSSAGSLARRRRI